MTIVYEDEYMTITHHEDLDLLEAAQRIKDEADLRRNLLKFLEMMEQYNPGKILWDMRESKFTYDPDNESWINENIHTKQVELGIAKKAFVMPLDLNVRIGIEETMDTGYGKQIETAYFLTREEAMEWLKKPGR